MKKQLHVILALILSVFILVGFTLIVSIRGTTETSNVVSAESSVPDNDRDGLSSKKCAIYEDCENGCEVELEDIEDECCFTDNYCDGDCETNEDCTGNCGNEP